jgi:hypothetical protein
MVSVRTRVWYARGVSFIATPTSPSAYHVTECPSAQVEAEAREITCTLEGPQDIHRVVRPLRQEAEAPK